MKKYLPSLIYLLFVFSCSKDDKSITPITPIILKSSEKLITAFSYTNSDSVIVASIDQTNKTIKVPVDMEKTDITKLIPTIAFSAKATVSPETGVVQNFTNPINYTVTAEDGSTRIYEVKIEKRLVSSVPKALGLNIFYKKYIDANGIPIISSNKVPDEALVQARDVINQMLEKITSKRTDIFTKLKQNKLRVAIMAKTEVITDIPERSDIYTISPTVDWNTRARGLGADFNIPCICAEENVLCYSADVHRGGDILIHEFAHSIYSQGLYFIDTKLDSEIQATFKEAKSKGLWENTYAGSGYGEYWAEGVQDWYDVNKESIPSNGVHNEINTRAELKIYDPKLYELISRYFDEPTKKVSCHRK